MAAKKRDADLQDESDILRKRIEKLEQRCRELESAAEHGAARERTYRTLLDDLTIGVFRLSYGEDLSIIECNPALAETLGFPDIDTCRGFAFRGMFYDQGEYEQLILTLRETGIVRNYELLMKRIDEIPFHSRITVTLTRDSHGNPLWIDGITENITEQKQSELDNLVNSEKYRLLFESLPVGVTITDESGKIIEANHESERLLGISTNEQTIRRFDSKEWRIIRPDGTIMPSEEYASVRALAQNRTVRNVVMGVARPDGEVSWINVTAAPIPLPGYGVIITYADVTERTRALEALSESEERFRSLFEAMHEIVALHEMIYDASGRPVDYRIIDVNPAFETILDIPRVKAAGVLASELYGADEPPYLTEYARVVETCEAFTFDTFFPPMQKYFTISVVSLGNRMFATITWDVTERVRTEDERRRLEQQVLHAQKLESLGVLAGGIAHDFNNLLMGILGNADMALMDLSKYSPARKSVLDIVTAAQRAADLSRQMLAYSGRGRFVITRIDFNEIILEMTHLLEVSITKSAVLKFKLASNLPLIEGDATQFRQVIMNLVTNASEAIGDRSGVISISTGAMDCDKDYLSKIWIDEELVEGLYVYIEVSDTGAGMDRETLAKIFDPFFTTKFTGRGLGLAAVQGIVRGHRGAIKVYSEPEAGTTFKILLPAVEATETDTVPDTVALHDGGDGSGVILLADDEDTVRTVGKRMIERMGYSVITAKDGYETLEAFREHGEDIRVIILDLTMPRMGGEEAFRELRRIRDDVKVILSSGYNEQEISNRFAGKGLSGFIQKPYNLSELSRMLDHVLGVEQDGGEG